jgi:plastocyanin
VNLCHDCQAGGRTARHAHASGWRPGVLLACCLAALVAVPACGNGYGGGSSGGASPISPSTGGPGAVAATITIANGSVSPPEVRIGVGQSVVFRNNDTRARDMTSDPHPTHTNCPSINAVGVLQPGQERATHGFGATGTCGFHDHLDPDNPGVRGRIIVE